MPRALRHLVPLGLLAAPLLAGAQAPSSAAPKVIPAAAVTPADRWWEEGVVYQVYPRSFQDSDGNGVGDLRGITQRLDYLKTLGINAIWISPFFPSPMRDFGYDVADYTGVDSTFGTLADFDALAKAAHARGIRVILDFVANHSSDQHPWFKESRSSRTNPKRDWYIWRDPAPGGGPPNNWLSVFGGSGWTRDSTTGQYYFHQFLKEQPDLNWRNPELQKAMLAAMRFWLDRGADGFRLDAFPHFVEDSLFRDNPVNPNWRPGSGEYDSLQAVHTTHQPGTLDVLCQMRRVANSYQARDGRSRLLIGEVYASPQQLNVYYGKNGCGAQLPSNFGLLGAPWKSDVIWQRIDDYMRALPAGRWPNWVLGNHDNPRLATRLGPDAARAAAVLLLTLPGTPTIYYGDELGMRNVPIPPDRVQDPAEKQQPGLGLGRDPERTPMQWTGSAPNGGFTTGTPWLPVASDVDSVNVAREQRDSASTLALYERLLKLRKTEPALARGSFRLLPRQGDVVAFLREDGSRGRYLTLVNVGTTATTYAPAAGDRLTRGGKRRGTIVAGTRGRRGDRVTAADIALEPNEGVVIRLK
ncbi:MAG: DUF3459 domain-containing protein [Gemmatimonadaceae bacterium]|nr:DUF3459 domain-containing protein [Gemmatimonadaceae bacterium]